MAIKPPPEGDFESELNKGALWAVTYGDLMSYLMIFFLIMFAFSISKKSGTKKAKNEVDDSLASIQKVFGGKVDAKRKAYVEAKKAEEDTQKRLEEAVLSKNLSSTVEIKANEERVQLTLKDAVLFDSGFAELKPQARLALETIANELKGLPNEIMIEGHTDNIPIRGGKFRNNYELSMARAYSVVEFFLSIGLDPRKLSGVGYGEYRPKGDNTTPEGRASNRRIEIDLIRSK